MASELAFKPGQAVVVTDAELLATYGRALRKIGKSVVVVPLGAGLHGGHIQLIRAARSMLGAVVFVTYSGEDVPEEFAREKVDVVYHGSFRGAHVHTGLEHLEDPGEIATDVATILAAANATHATDLVLGEKDFELLVAVQRALSALRMEVKLHSVPTVRTPDGLALSLRNSAVPVALRDTAIALPAALTAGAHAAEQGADAVLDAARRVLGAAGIEPEYVALRSLSFEAVESGDARLLGAVNLGGVRLTDNVGVPLGVGFRNLTA